ncbi:MAG: nucleoside deaminase [Pseudomonadota bacterium]
MERKASFMELAHEQAKDAASRGEVPVGAVLVKDGRVISCDGNRTLELSDPTAHAEVLVIRAGAKLARSERLVGHDLYVTLEPCTLCAAAISFARIRRLYFGAGDPKSGAVENGVRFFDSPNCHHAPEIYSGIMETETSGLLRSFFKQKREPSRS